MIINLAKIRFGGGASAKPEDSFQETYTANGSYDITPEKGHVFSGGHVEVDVHPTDKLTRTYTENNTYEISGEWTNAEITVAVPGPVEETFDITPTNSDITVVPTVADNVFSGGVVRGYDVDPIYNALDDLNTGDPVPPVTPFVVPDGMKFRSSTFTTVPSGLDFSQITSGDIMFDECINLTRAPQIGSNLTTMNQMFRGCTSLINITDLDTSNVTSMSYAFASCSSLSNFSSLDLSSCTNLAYAFAGSAITSFSLDTANAQDFYNIFESCNNLTSIIDLDLTNSYLGSNPPDMFGWNGLPAVTYCTLKGSLNRTTSFAELPNIGSESIQSILTAAANTILPSDEKSLIFKHEITSSNDISNLISACTAKGWTVEGLTIN